ncbi:tyrosine-type recombinase/integrase [Rhodopirellula bahusiensis]|uniref:Uncharacterized protein n=1 Tax=Rhodopirellula bahusiensis TaxID=2014065 RepID=A0A2G1W7Z4_9BACT|nr:tyrosine-type recombinase/integrase [Rhodopirellula bahusiensis]PHQ35164.1 hypothetical protein CEE69_12195 [Rhodopirellula bahusiensis]
MTKSSQAAVFPLFRHRNGQWAKKVNGKHRYFGADRDEALKRWLETKDDLLAGVEPTPVADSPTIAELANLYIDRCRLRVESDEMAGSTAIEYENVLHRMIGFVGREAQPATWKPIDFAKLKERLHEPIKRTAGPRGGLKGKSVKRRSATTVAIDIRAIKAFLNWCSKSALIPPPHFGPDFVPPSQKKLRKVKRESGRRDLSPADILSIIESASVNLKPLIFLGINAGIGNKDLSLFTLDRLPEMTGDVWIDYPRNKTEADRRFCLWPETRDAIATYLAKRPGPAGSSNTNLVFLTRQGSAWVRGDGSSRMDAIGQAFKKARTDAGVERGTFYDLRRTFQTVANETGDFQAARLVMGHSSHANDMTDRYTQAIGDDRIRRVINHVREWLYAS